MNCVEVIEHMVCISLVFLSDITEISGHSPSLEVVEEVGEIWIFHTNKQRPRALRFFKTEINVFVRRYD